jgi:ribonuclease P protein component
MKKRVDYLRAQKCVRKVVGALTLEICPTPAEVGLAGRYRTGFTATRKIGNSVARNRARRRLKAAAAKVLPSLATECTDYVLVARPGTLTRPFELLLSDLAQALETAHLKLSEAKGGHS